jgi:hypothetical protein
MAATVTFNTSTRAFQRYDQRSKNIKRYVRRRSKSATTATVLVAAVAAVTIITETIKRATIVKARN